MNRLAAAAAVLSFVVHASTILCSLNPAWRALPLLAPDSPTYIRPAENLVLHGAFSRESQAPFLWEPDRTVGYPLLIAGVLLAFGDAKWVMLIAALTAAASAWCAVELTRYWQRGRRTSIIAGVVAALLPNSLGLSCQVLTDAIVGHLMLIWLFSIFLSFRNDSRAALVAAICLGATLQALKPTFNLIGLLVPLIAFLWRGRRNLTVDVVTVVALSAIVPVFHAANNWRDHGVFSPTLLATATVRDYLQVRALAEDAGVDVTAMMEAVRARDRITAQELEPSTSFYGRLHEVKEAEVSGFLRREPVRALRLASTEMARQFAAPEELVFQVFAGALPLWCRAIGSAATLLFWGCALGGGVVLGRAGRPAGSAWVLLAVVGFFLVTGSVSHFVGARLRFPADMVAVPFFAVGLDAVLRSAQSWRAGAASPRGSRGRPGSGSPD